MTEEERQFEVETKRINRMSTLASITLIVTLFAIMVVMTDLVFMVQGVLIVSALTCISLLIASTVYVLIDIHFSGGDDE